MKFCVLFLQEPYFRFLLLAASFLPASIILKKPELSLHKVDAFGSQRERGLLRRAAASLRTELIHMTHVVSETKSEEVA